MKTGTDRRIAESECINCHAKLDGATSVGCDESPSPGDFSVCIKCGHLMAFGHDLQFRELTEAEMHQIAGDPRIIAAQKAISIVSGTRKS